VQRLGTTGFAGQPIGLATHRQKEGADGLLAVDDVAPVHVRAPTDRLTSLPGTIAAGRVLRNHDLWYK